MRKILISTLILLLIVMACLVIFKGISIGNFNILSVNQISDENEKLTKEILQAEVLMYSTFKSKTDELNRNLSNLLTAKQEYLDLANISSEKQISKASQQETYTVEFLWTRLGRHATAQGVILKYEIASGTTGEENVKNILFTVTGNYIPIIDFIRAIEDDSDLAFRIENFKMVPSGDVRQATFVTKNIRIKSENTTTTVKPTTDNEQANKVTNTNTEQTTQPTTPQQTNENEKVKDNDGKLETSTINDILSDY